jgi:hypothetical protein
MAHVNCSVRVSAMQKLYNEAYVKLKAPQHTAEYHTVDLTTAMYQT